MSNGPDYTVTVIDDCSDLSGWTKVNGTSGRDVEESTDYVLNGDASLRYYDTTRASNIMTEKALAHSFASDDRLGMIYYIETHGAGDTSGFMSQGSDNAGTFTSGNRWQRLQLYTQTRGWAVMPFSFGETTVLGGAPTIATAYQAIRIGLTTNASFDREIYIDSIVRYRSRPKVIITFDDGKESQYTEAFAYAEPLGVPLTLFVPPSSLGGSGFLTRAQVLEMMVAGCDVGAHSQTANAWETPSQIKVDADGVAQLTGNRTRFGSWPNGRYGQTQGNWDACEDGARAAGLDGCRTIGTSPLAPFAFSPYYMQGGPSLTTGFTVSAALAHIDKCIKHGLTAVFYGHVLDTAAAADTWAIADFRSLIDGIVTRRKQGLIDAVTLSQWWDNATRAPAGR